MNKSLNPLKRVNSILTRKKGFFFYYADKRLNPLKRVNSILTISLKYYKFSGIGLNPLKRVNSILTRQVSSCS